MASVQRASPRFPDPLPLRGTFSLHRLGPENASNGVMPTARSPYLVPLGLLGVAVICLLFLGLRAAVGERAAAEAHARTRLRAGAAEGARQVLDAVTRLRRQALERGPQVGRLVDGRFLAPGEPVVLTEPTPVRGRDPVGEWLLARAEQAEFGDKGAAVAAPGDSAEGLYRAAAAAEQRDPAIRQLALKRLAGWLLKEGREADAVAVRDEFLESMSPADQTRCRSALLFRALSPERDATLADDLLACVGGPDEGVALGLLEQAGLAEAGRVAGRRREVERLRRWGSLVADQGDLEAEQDNTGDAAAIVDAILVVRVELADVGTLFAEQPLPVLPADVVLLPPETATPATAELLVETVAVGDLLPGTRVAATRSMSSVAREADSRSALTLAALFLLLSGLGLAVWLMVRAARRESIAARDRARFVAQVGHDLRTPLALIRMYAETLASGKVTDKDEAREFAGIAAREARRLSGLVGSVLDLSRAESDRVAASGLDLGRLVEDVVAAHRPLFEEERMALELTLPEAAIMVTGDPDSLRGALANLLENGLRHAASGGRLEVGVETAGREVRVRVADRGPGLPSESDMQVDNLFERFTRGPEAGGRGAGLGLALVREVAERHGGRVSARDRSEGGALFVLTLPCAAGESA